MVGEDASILCNGREVRCPQIELPLMCLERGPFSEEVLDDSAKHARDNRRVF